MHALSSFWLAHINRHALLVTAQAAKPRTDTIDIELTPYAQRITFSRRLDLYDIDLVSVLSNGGVLIASNP